MVPLLFMLHIPALSCHCWLLKFIHIGNEKSEQSRYCEEQCHKQTLLRDFSSGGLIKVMVRGPLVKSW
jgi:hypothetical protein